MVHRYQHQSGVLEFLRNHFASPSWELSLPYGQGNETYIARSEQQTYFIKLGVPVDRYQAVACLGLTPPVIATGSLQDGVSILVQAYAPGKEPSPGDYQFHLEEFAIAIHRLHHSPAVREALPPVAWQQYRDAGLEALTHLQQNWQRYRKLVPGEAAFVDASLEELHRQVLEFEGGGLVASHNDICNANWILTLDERLYLVDLEAMSLDDPALDIGATLWWYYPPWLRERFLVLAGYRDDPTFPRRMQVRMAMHCLHIILPRPGSFDRFDPPGFSEALADFRAVLAGEENPQGYDD